MTPGVTGDSAIVVIVQVLDRCARRRDLRRVVAGQVGADLFPVIALIDRLEQHLRAGVDDVAVERRQRERRCPVPAQRRLAWRSHGGDCLAHPGPLVEPVVPAPLERVVDPAAVVRIDPVVLAIVVAHRHPVLRPDAPSRPVDGAPPRVMVLQAAVDVIRAIHVNGNRVELAARDVRVVVARPAGVVGDVDAAVAAKDPAVGVLRVDPHRAEVAEPLGEQVPRVPREALPRPAAVLRAEQRVAVDDDPPVVVRIDPDLIERVPRLRTHVVGRGVHLPPRPAAVVGSVDLAADRPRLRILAACTIALRLLLRRRTGGEVLGHRVEDFGVLLVDVEADSALLRGQTGRQLLPGPPAVGRLENAAALSALQEFPRPSLHVVHRRVERVGALAVEHEVDGAGPIVEVEDLLPGLSAVGRLEHAALLVGRPEAAHRRDVDDVGVGGMDDDAADVLRLAQPHVLPGLARVDRLVDAVARVGHAHA